MKPIRLLTLFALLFAVVLVACAPGGDEPAAVPETTPVAGEAADATVTDYDSLIEALRATGVNVEPAGTLEDPFFPVDAFSLTVDGAPVSVFQFPSEAAAAEAAESINATGTVIGTTSVDWIEPPHFYRQGRLIVLYAGEDEAVLAALAAVVGEPFVVGEAMFGPALEENGEEPATVEDTPEGTPADEVTHSGPIVDYVSLVDALRATGATVEPVEGLQQPFFDPLAQVVEVNGERVQIFEFSDEEAAVAAAETVSPGGSSIGTTMLTWQDTPHFYRVDRLIVLYVGSDEDMLTLLQQAVGEPFAGG